MIELEKTYLAKFLPEKLQLCPFKEIIDIYIPNEKNHSTLRIRKCGDTYEITKKQPEHGGDSSKQTEHTISLTPMEFNLLRTIPGKRVHKIRYYYPYHERTIEIDVFQKPLQGLVLVDVEFLNEGEKDAFQMPPFCLREVTQELLLAGGMLCGKTYEDIAHGLEAFHYTKLFLTSTS